MVDFISKNASVIIAGIALVLSAFANWRAEKQSKESKAISKSYRRKDLLLGIEKNYILERDLALVLSQKILLISKCSKLEGEFEEELERLEKNLKSLNKQISNQENMRNLAENTDWGDSIDKYTDALINIQRAQIKIKSDLEIERNSYLKLKEYFLEQ